MFSCSLGRLVLLSWCDPWSVVSCSRGRLVLLSSKLSSRRQFELEPLVSWSLVSWFLDLLSSWSLGLVVSDLRTLCVHKSWRSNPSHFYFLALDNAPVPENKKVYAFIFAFVVSQKSPRMTNFPALRHLKNSIGRGDWKVIGGTIPR